MRTISISILVILLLLLSFAFVYQFSYNDYVYAFKPSNAPPANETILTTNTSKQQQQQSSNNQDSLEIDNKTIASNNGEVTANEDGFLVYENSTYGIRIEYPSNWDTFTIPEKYSMFSAGTHIVGFVLPDQYEIFHIEVVEPGDSFEHYLAARIDSLKQDPVRIKIIETRALNVAGYPAFQIVYTAADSNPSDKYMYLLVKVDNKVYFLTYTLDIERYAQYLPLAQKMIDSLQINSSAYG